MSKEPTRYLRREFLGQCAAVPLVVNVAAAAEPPQSQPAKAASVPTPIRPDSTITRLTTDEIRAEVDRLMQFVEPEVAYHYTPLPPDKNAWPHWAKAHAAYVSYESDEELKRVLEETVLEHDRWPDGNERDLVLKWLTANEAAKKLIDQGIAVGHVELPRDPNAVSLSLAMDEISLVRELALLKSICCTRALAERRHDEAAREAFSLLEMGSILLRGQCMLVDYLVGMAIYGMGAACIGRVGLHGAVARRLKRECIEQLTTNKLRREDLKQALRVEYCRWFLPQIAAYPDVSPRGLARWYVESEDNADYQPTARQKKARDRYIDATAFMLDEHPRLPVADVPR